MSAIAHNYEPPPGTGVMSTDEPGCDISGLTPAQIKLQQLKAKLNTARQQNHKAVVQEDRRNKLGPEGLKAERQKKWEEENKDAPKDPESKKKAELDKLMNTTASTAGDKLSKAEKKSKRRGETGWDVFNNEAQYRHYKKQMRRAEHNGVLSSDAEAATAVADVLAYGEAEPVSKERTDALVEDLHEAALRRAAWSRRRTFHEDKDVTYINKRNEVYNKKIERAFDPYTTEIRANLERGTAL